MPISQWPCIPDKLTDLIDGDLIRFILAGASEKYQLPLAIVDNNTDNSYYVPYNETQQIAPFCRCLRERKHDYNSLEINELIIDGLNDNSNKATAPNIHDDNDIRIKTLKFGTNVYNDRELVLRIWLPNRKSSEELLLLSHLKISEPIVLDLQVKAIIEAYLESILNIIRTADYSAAKEVLSTKIIHGYEVTSQELINAIEVVIYYEMWRLNMKFIEPIGLKDWLNKEKEIPINNDDTELDNLLACHIMSLIYYAQKNDKIAKNRLKQVIKIEQDQKYICFEKTPKICPGQEMKRTRFAIALATNLLDNVSQDKKDEFIKEAEEIMNECDQEQNKDIYADKCSLIELKASRLLNKINNVNNLSNIESLDGQIAELIWNIRTLANNLKSSLLNILRTFTVENNNCHQGYFNISSLWLDAWFGLQLIDIPLFPGDEIEYKESKEFKNNSISKLKYYNQTHILNLIISWACYFRHILIDFIYPKTRSINNTSFSNLLISPSSETVIISQLNLLCEWAHQKGVPRTFPLHSWLKSTYESEMALYALSARGSHRQHLFHVQDTCLLGYALLKSYSEENKNTLIEILANKSGYDQKQLFCNWLVASLLHDIGYVLQLIPRGLETLADGITKGLGELVNDIRFQLEQASSDITNYDPTPNRTSYHMKVAEHAHVSMATIVSHLRSLGDQGQTADYYNLATAAIIEHDSKDTPINYDTDPLSALLVICDQLQDWGRTRLNTSALTHNFLTSIRKEPGDKPMPIIVEELFPSSKLFIRAKLDENGNLLHSSEVMSFLLEGPRAGEKGYEPAVAWLDVCRALQRIRLSNNLTNNYNYNNEMYLPKIQVELRHKIAEDGLSELRRLSVFAHKNLEKYGTILDWLDRVKEDNFIKYNILDKDELKTKSEKTNCTYRESIEFTIPDLNNEEIRPLKGLPDKLYRAYLEFRESTGQKEFRFCD